MLRRTLTRILTAVAILLVVSAVVFLGTEALPGDAADAALGQSATPELLQQYREDFGLNEPVLQRYLDWLGGLAQGDLGRSIPSGDPVTTLISERARNTAILSALVLALLVPLSLVLGTLSAVRRDSALDHVVASATLGFIAMPEFVVGTLFVLLFASVLDVLPAVSLIDPSRSVLAQGQIFVLPVLTLLAAILAQTTRMVRACMIDALDSDYVQMARLKGESERSVVWRHAIPNALGPAIQVIALNVAWLAGGVVVTEKLFQFPGLGLTLADAVSVRDIATVQAIVLIITAVYILVTVLAEIAHVALNPRLARAR
jgi:peptide/nickel transport system permease protein